MTGNCNHALHVGSNEDDQLSKNSYQNGHNNREMATIQKCNPDGLSEGQAQIMQPQFVVGMCLHYWRGGLGIDY